MCTGDTRQEIGRQAEDAACALLEARGWSVVERNWRPAHGQGEIDVICRKGDVVLFVEVRSATTGYLGSPAETVDNGKQTRIVRAAELYLHERRLHRANTRFDVIAVRVRRGAPQLDWLVDAFRPASTARATRFR